MQSLHKNKRKKYIYIIIIFVVIFLNPFNIVGQTRGAFMNIVSPVFSRGYGLGTYISSRVNMISQIGVLYKQNQKLQEEVQKLKVQNAQILELQNENETLRKNLNLTLKKELNLLGAEVILRDSLGGNHWVLIDRGQKDGLSLNMEVVVNDNVFVGYIDRVDNSTARVRLITNPESIVNVVDARSGAEAVAYGKHGLSVVVEDIKKDDDVQNGDVFVTSAIGNIFDEGFGVGVVQNVSTSEDNLFKSAHLAPLVDLGKLKFVFVVK